MTPIEEFRLEVIFKVEAVKLDPINNLWIIDLSSYSGTMCDLQLYSIGDFPCPFQTGDFYGADDNQHGGWSLTRLEQSVIDELNHQGKKWESAQLLVSDTVRRTELCRRPQEGENQCRALVEKPKQGSASYPARCGYVEGHAFEHWSGRGAGAGYYWRDETAYYPGADQTKAKASC